MLHCILIYTSNTWGKGLITKGNKDMGGSNENVLYLGWWLSKDYTDLSIFIESYSLKESILMYINCISINPRKGKELAKEPPQNMKQLCPDLCLLFKLS